jgi:lipoyl(octanoyl) transferase
MPSSWTLWLDLEGRPGFRNMAIDQALLGRAAERGERWLRLYRWAPHCLSFGRHEPATRRYDRQRAEALGLDAVRRPTGGRAVWHSDELTYAVALPADGLGGVRAVCADIHAMLRDGLSRLGVAVFAADTAPALRPGAGACFAAPAGGELMLGDRKVVGSAQLRERGALLQHGTILLSGDQSRVAEVTRGAVPADLAGGLSRALGRRPEPAAVAEAIAAAAVCCWPGRWGRAAGDDGPVADAAPFEPRFRSPAWTWGH